MGTSPEKLLNNPAIARELGSDLKYYLMGPDLLGRPWYYASAKGMDRTSWKLHVSASNRDALEELFQLGMKHRLPECKFIDAEYFPKFQNAANSQCGKTAVFYHYVKDSQGKALDWEQFMREAEEIVHKHGGPGPAVQRDRPIKGSSALYYRNEQGVNGTRYIPRDGITQYGKQHNIPEAQLHNLPNAPDPFAHIDLSRPRQAAAEAVQAESATARLVEEAAQIGEKTAKQSHGKTAWIVGGILAATTGVGVWLAATKKKSHAAEEMERRRQSAQGQSLMP